MKTECDALEAVSKDWSTLGEVPEALRTPEICLKACRQCGMSLAVVPNDVLSPEICLVAVKADPTALTQVPDRLLTPALVAAACASADEVAPSPLRVMLGVHQEKGRLFPRHARTSQTCHRGAAAQG